MEMCAYAREQGSALLGRLVFRVNRVIKLQDPDGIHDLRVGIRRFIQCIRVFDEFFPRAELKRIRRRLKQIRDLAGEGRDRDIALKLWAEAGLPSNESLLVILRQERKQAQQALVTQLDRLRRRDFSRKWRKRLNL